MAQNPLVARPYPEHLAGEIALRDGSRVWLRPIRPEDAQRLQRFAEGLSEESRYQRFMYHLRELTPRMLERFTRLDYARELALVALDPRTQDFIAVGRYAPNDDGVSAEFGLAVADAWQRKGLGRALLARLCDAARDAGYAALHGHMLESNRPMLELCGSLGFVQESRTGADVTVVKRLK
jgi:acetyltransferase